jgi:rubredoxin
MKIYEAEMKCPKCESRKRADIKTTYGTIKTYCRVCNYVMEDKPK